MVGLNHTSTFERPLEGRWDLRGADRSHKTEVQIRHCQLGEAPANQTKPNQQTLRLELPASWKVPGAARKVTHEHSKQEF